MAPEVWIVLLLFLVVTVPVLIGVLAFSNRTTPRHEEEAELKELKRRIEELESKQE